MDQSKPIPQHLHARAYLELYGESPLDDGAVSLIDGDASNCVLFGIDLDLVRHV